MYAVTGASGQLGRLTIEALLKRVPASKIIALVRDPAKVADFAAQGVVVRTFNYDEPASLNSALEGVERLLLISSSEVGKRGPQHGAVIAAAQAAGVKYVLYTSILRGDKSPLVLAGEHIDTEEQLKKSGLAYALLRNGWYNENYTMGLEATAEQGAVVGSSGEGRVSAASRADFAEAAAIVLTDGSTETRVFELAGDEAFTQSELARLIAAASGKPVVYHDMPEEDYAKLLASFGLPDAFAAILANSSAQAGNNALFDDSQTLSKLIGRPTTSIAASVQAAFRS